MQKNPLFSHGCNILFVEDEVSCPFLQGNFGPVQKQLQGSLKIGCRRNTPALLAPLDKKVNIHPSLVTFSREKSP